MIQKFITSALIIDDEEKEIADLQRFLEQLDIWVKHYTPDMLDKHSTTFKNRKLIFLDLYLVNSDSLVNNISRIRKYFTKIIGRDFGAYGLVIWTKHLDEINHVKTRISKDAVQYQPPLFIVGLDKTKYLKAGNYDSVLADLEAELNKNIASKFFIEWNTLVDKGRDNTISNIFSIEPDYDKQEQNLRFILFQIAKNYTGIPTNLMAGHNLTKDTIKGFTDMLHHEIVSNANHSNFLFDTATEFFFRHDLAPNTSCEYSTSNFLSAKLEDKAIKLNGIAIPKANLKRPPEKDHAEEIEKKIIEIYASLNSQMLFDIHNLNQAIVLPGNIYEIISDSPFKLDNTDLPQNSTHIIIEVTPPCDFSNSKKGSMSRIIAGFYCDYDANNVQLVKKKGDAYYKELWPVNFAGNNAKIFAFDFRYFGAVSEIDLKDAAKYKLISKAKDKLFADILQKLAAHTARLGLSVIH